MDRREEARRQTPEAELIDLRNHLTKTEIAEPERLSFSSLSSYAECGERWRLERFYGVRSSTWYATVAGTAIHYITELIDGDLDDEVIPTFQQVFDIELEKEESAGILVKPSGKKLVNVGPQGGPSKKDYDWWLEWGPRYIGYYRDWREASDWELLDIPSFGPAIEVPLEASIGGGKKLGYVDRVFRRPSDGELILVDLKTGNDPASNLQLGDYRLGLKRQYGIEVNLGGFWSAQKGDVGYLVDLSVYTEEFVEHLYTMAWRGIRAGVFLPNPSSLCNACDGRPFCRAVGGRDSGTYPVQTVVNIAHITEEALASSPDGV